MAGIKGMSLRVKRPKMGPGIRKGAQLGESKVTPSKSPSIENLNKELGHRGSENMPAIKRAKF